jgi:DNA-binding transcriptional regulator PaaX
MSRKYGELAKNILFGLSFSGAFIVAATSPFFLLNIATYIKKNRKYFKKEFDEKKIAKAIERLKKKRLIVLSEKNGKFKVEITEKGKRKIKEIQFENMAIEKPNLWDRQWRIVIFDVPDKYKKRARDALRGKLQKMGFYPLQKSVWVYPYPCEKEIQFLCELFNIIPFVNIIVAKKIYNDIKLRKYFNLF